MMDLRDRAMGKPGEVRCVIQYTVPLFKRRFVRRDRVLRANNEATNGNRRMTKLVVGKTDLTGMLKRQVVSRWCHFLCIGVLISGLSACGVDTEPTAPETTTTTVNDVAMFGEEGVDTNPDDTIVHVEIPMDQNQTVSALYNVTWDVTSSDPYAVTTYISDDSSLDETADQLFFTTKCGSDNTLYPCDSLGDRLCGFSYQPEYSDPTANPPVVSVDHYYMTCFGQTVEITDRVTATGFPATPFNQNIIFQACNGAGDSCDTRSFQFDIVDSIP